MNSILPSIATKSTLLEKVLRKLAGSYLEKSYYRSFFQPNEKPTEEKESNKRILLYSGISSMYLTPVEILFYHSLKQQGFDIDYLVYDQSVTYNEITTKERRDSEGDVFWHRSVQHGLSLLDAANVSYQTISISEIAVSIVNQLPDDTEQLFSFKYEGYAVGDIVKGVMYRYYKSISMGSDATEVAKQFMITTLTNYFEIKSRCETTQYHSILFSHGIYCTWQIIVDYCKNQQLDFICYDRGKTKGCININRNQPSPVWDISEAWKRLEDYNLSADEENLVDDYLKERETQKGDVFAYNFSEKSEDTAALKRQLQIKESAKVITIFTNLIWDAANVSRDIAFDSPLDCIKKTIDHYQNNSDVHVLIRCHPAEKVLGTSERYGELVRAEYTHLPSNVTIIEPEMDINSFSILDISSVGIVHTSTVGIEMALEGKPVILISETHYRNKGFTYDADDANDYFKTLDHLISTISLKVDQVALARKYFYLMMFEYQHKMPMEFCSNGSFNGYSKSSFDQLVTEEGSSIKAISNAIEINRTDYIFR